jgi:hypothetical protein
MHIHVVAIRVGLMSMVDEPRACGVLFVTISILSFSFSSLESRNCIAVETPSSQSLSRSENIVWLDQLYISTVPEVKYHSRCENAMSR